MLPDSELETVALTLYDIGAVRLGRFRLHSGRTSLVYLDLRLLVSHPDALRRAAGLYRALLQDLIVDRLAATPLAGLPIGTAVSLAMDLPLIYPRKSAKSYGTGKEIEGEWKVGETAVVVDDLITSGDSILQAIATLKAAGLQINEAAVLIDREQGGREALAAQGYQLHAAMTLTHLLAVLESRDRITAGQRTQILQSLQE